ncbi:uncharacterized protein LOC119067554 isoform X2 [Bradysia coprophila]|uniref:uncharacterized protein LOC119067554 isoform X2 n=1 Tax=Bradysia coprophila TaxID=38358 RepID=UPI00187DA15D|nr:uncharacterized protein LOC119067554 isoform X2 [Bradysia coprophila]
MRLLSLKSRPNVCKNIFSRSTFIFVVFHQILISIDAAPTIQPGEIERNATDSFTLSKDTLVNDVDNVNKTVRVEHKNIGKVLEKTSFHDDNFNDKLAVLNANISTLDKKDDGTEQHFDEGSSKSITEKEAEFIATTIETFINIDKINRNAVTVDDKENSDGKLLEQLKTNVPNTDAKTIDENRVSSSTPSSDPYFISDLSDLLAENREFDRVSDIADGDVIHHPSTPKGRFGDLIMDSPSTTTHPDELYQQGNTGDVELIEKSRDLEINIGHEMVFTPTEHDVVKANVTVAINQYDKDEQMVKSNDGMGIAETTETKNDMTTTTTATITTINATTTIDTDSGKAIKTVDVGKNATKPKHNTSNNSSNAKKYMSGEKNQKKKTNLGRDGVKANKKQFSNNKSNLLPPEETEYATTTTTPISSDVSIIEASTLKSLPEFTNILKVVNTNRDDQGPIDNTNEAFTETAAVITSSTTATTVITPTFTLMSTSPITATQISSRAKPDNASHVEHVFDSIELLSSSLPNGSSATEMEMEKIISRNDVANETDILVVEILERLNGTEESGSDVDKLDIIIEIETTDNTFDNLHKNDSARNESATDIHSTTETLLTFEDFTANSSDNIRPENDNANRKLTNKILESSDSDEFFVPEDIKERENAINVIIPETTTTSDTTQDKEHTKQSTVDHDADTIFYISNTEVKVIESAPTPNTNQESQFFPAVYEEDVIIDFSGKNFSGWGNLPDKYEEDIILSPLKNNFDPLKLNDENLSISYVGESFIDVKESTNNDPLSKSTNNPFTNTEIEPNTITSDVIIQPVQLPEAIQQQQIPIGVPIIQQLPPQIEIKQIEYNYDLSNMSHGDRKKGIEGVTSRVIIHSGDSLQTNHLSAELPQDTSTNKDVKSMPSKRNGNGINATTASVVNGTAYSVLDDEPENSILSYMGFNDVKTLLLALFATLVPLSFFVFAVFCVKWAMERLNLMGDNRITGDISTDPLAAKSRTVSADEDMARNARETKMHYSPSEKGGVFVVEAARGADSTAACNGTVIKDNSIAQQSSTPIVPTSPKNVDILSRDDATLLNNEEIQVHQPPLGISDDEILNVDDDGVISMAARQLNGDDSMRPISGSTNTGLSQSDLSISDSCGSNQGYCYGSQQPYTIEAQGYQSSSPHLVNDIKPAMSPSDSKPIIKSAIYKQESVEPASSYPEDGRPGKLRSDKNISEFCKPLKEEALIEEQRQLGNGEILIETQTDNALKVEIAVDTVDKVSENDKTGDVANEIVENGDGYDSLICLPAPPTIDEIKQLNDITLLDNNNMDSLPPPPPPEVIVEGPTNGES